MNIERREEHDYGFGKPAGEPGKRGNAGEALLLLFTILALIGIAAGIAIRFPWVLENAVTPAYAQDEPSVPPAPEPQEAPEEELDEQPEPLIVDDVRTANLMYAASGITRAMARATPDPSNPTR